MQRLTIFSRAVSAAWSARSVRPARVSAVLTAMLIVAGAVFAATVTAPPL